MATIRHRLQREVLNPSEEKLTAVVHVNKAFKKKKSSFLCLVVSSVTPITVSIHQIKKNDKNVYKKKQKWLLSDLKTVDGKDASPDTHEFDLHFDKVYKWSASNAQERQNFITWLWKYCCKHLPKQKPSFINVPSEWLIDMSSPEKESPIPSGLSLAEEEEAIEDYQAISENEEKDLEKLMDSCQTAISNAESFMETLAKDLSLLDGENVHSVLSSGQKVEHLMMKLEEAIQEAEKVEAQLDSYDGILRHIRDTMEKMEEKNLLIEVANKNNRKLLVELENIISQLDLSQKHQNALIDADLTNPAGLKEAISAGKALMAAMNVEIHPALVRMQAVQDQRKRFDKCKNKFSQTITRHLNNLFIHLGNDAGETLSAHARDLTLPNHNSVHRELIIYAELIHWCKAMDRKAYVALSKVYVNSFNKLYDRDIRNFFEEAKMRISGPRERRAKGGGSKEDLAGKIKQQAQSLSSGVGAKTVPQGNLIGIEREQWSQEIDQGERMRFDEIFERALTELEPVCLSEQNFCVQFFQLDVLSPTTKNTQTTLDTGLAELREETDSASVALPTKKIEKQINEEVRKMMGDLFHCLESELNSFISYYEKLDGFYCMYVLVRLTQHVMSAQDTESFLAKTFASALVQVKRSYDKFMQAQLRSIEEMKPNRKTKCGILPFVSNFEEFAHTAELIFKHTDRRGDLDKWHLKLVSAMFDAIPRIASEHPKTPQEVVKMENFHHLHDLLSQLKIPVLDSHRKDAKSRYNEALKNYVTQYFGRPLEKLNLFFDGVEAKIAQGVKESEISYQMAFSKEQLRKVISAYPAREVKKGLEHLYKKVEKHLSEEENLLQVVWRAMQEEFIQQYKYLEEFIQRCYPGSMITLEFSMNDILEFFSDIARSH